MSKSSWRKNVNSPIEEPPSYPPHSLSGLLLSSSHTAFFIFSSLIRNGGRAGVDRGAGGAAPEGLCEAHDEDDEEKALAVRGGREDQRDARRRLAPGRRE